MSEDPFDGAESDSGDSDWAGITKSVDVRWAYTNDIVGGCILFSLPVLLYLAGAGTITLQSIPTQLLWTYGSIVAGTAMWMFGVDALKAAHEIRRN